MTEPPVLRIVAGGQPSDEETAALTAVLTVVATAAAAQDEQPATRSRWRDSSHPTAPWVGAGWLAAARRSALRQHR